MSTALPWSGTIWYSPNAIAQRLGVVYQATALQPNYNQDPSLDTQHSYWIVYNGGGGNTVSSINAGAGITVTNGTSSSPTVATNLVATAPGIAITTGVNANELDVANTGVTSVIAGTNISVSSASGAVTITNTMPTPPTGIVGVGDTNNGNGYGLEVYGTVGNAGEPYISISTGNSFPTTTFPLNYAPGNQVPYDLGLGQIGYGFNTWNSTTNAPAQGSYYYPSLGTNPTATAQDMMTNPFSQFHLYTMGNDYHGSGTPNVYMFVNNQNPLQLGCEYVIYNGSIFQPGYNTQAGYFNITDTTGNDCTFMFSGAGPYSTNGGTPYQNKSWAPASVGPTCTMAFNPGWRIKVTKYMVNVSSLTLGSSAPPNPTPTANIYLIVTETFLYAS